MQRYSDDTLDLELIPSWNENLGRCESTLHIGALAIVTARTLTRADYQICLPHAPSLFVKCYTSCD